MRWAGVFGALLVAVGPIAADVVYAGPVEDMQEGEKAFDRGDVIDAMRWFQKAAEQGYAPAQARLGYLLDYSEDDAQAIGWYQKAAEQGEAEGQYGLAKMHSTGEAGEQNFEQAVYWFTQAAEQGHQPSIRVLAAAYERGGLGLDTSNEQALSWLRRAVDQPGGEWARRRLAKAYRNGELGLPVDPRLAEEWGAETGR